jgi:anti-anti-sigma factor
MTASSIDGAPHRLRIQRCDQGGMLWLRLWGEADMASIDDLRSQLRCLPPDTGGTVRLDLTELGFADSATVAQLAAFAATARRHGHQVSTCGASRLVETIAAVLGCSNALGLSDTAANR